MTHIAVEGGCFVLSANQFYQTNDYPPPEYQFTRIDEYLTPDSVVCAGSSVIISPSGVVLARPSYDEKNLLLLIWAQFDFDLVGHYARPEVLSLIVRDEPVVPVFFTFEKTESF